VTLEEHLSWRAFNLTLRNREVLCVTLNRTFRLGRWPLDYLIGKSNT
jgi:hypothetical protein